MEIRYRRDGFTQVVGATIAERIAYYTSSESRHPDECWPWTAHRNAKGYGKIKIGDGTYLAYRVAYELAVGPIPDGLQIDHLCRNRACCNPSHMEVVTSRENQLRSPIAHGGKTHCKRGHELAGDNLIPSKRARICRTCRDQWEREHRGRR